MQKKKRAASKRSGGTKTLAEASAGAIVAELLLNAWHSDKAAADTRAYIAGRRVHHGEIGMAMLAAGNFLKIKEVQDFGVALMQDDAADAKDWLTFRTLEQDLSDGTSEGKDRHYQEQSQQQPHSSKPAWSFDSDCSSAEQSQSPSG